MLNKAVKYLTEYVEALATKEKGLISEETTLNTKKEQLVLDREAPTAQESAFVDKTNGYGKEVERVDKMRALSVKMRDQAKEKEGELAVKEIELEKREKKITNLEKKKKKLIDLEEALKSKEESLIEREEYAEKSKKVAIEKQADLEILEKSMIKKQQQLQRMIDNQSV